MTAVHEQVGDFKAAQMQVVARTQTQFLHNLVAEARAARANGWSTPQNLASVAGHLPEDCGCKDCEAAVSPAAYLTDLVGYTLKHVRNNGQTIDLQFLEDTFHQPFGDLPTDCDAVEQRVRQMRICAEVLHGYLAAKPPAQARQDDLAKAEKEYLVNAYTLLLNNIGTSYDEVRLARTAKPEERRALAERLGIELTVPRPDPQNSPGDELDQLFLDPDALATGPRVLSEASLERLFGLPATKREPLSPLSEGAKLGDGSSPPQITRWNLDSTQWGRNTDAEGLVHLKLLRNTAGLARIEAYQDVGRTKLLAEGDQRTADGPIRLIPKNSSGLGGTFEVAFTTGSSTIAISAIPKFLCWRLKRLRTIWEQQDRPDDEYSEGHAEAGLDALPSGLQFPASLTNRIRYDAADRQLLFSGVMEETEKDTLLNLPGGSEPSYRAAVLSLFVDSQRPPLIDPDLIGPDDFRVPVVKASANAPDRAYDIWLARRKQVDETLASLRTERERNGVTAALQAVLGSTQLEETKLAIRARHLTVESFGRLLEIRRKDRLAAQGRRSEQVTAEEWREFDSILAQAEKAKRFPAWRKEETNGKLLLGLQGFWFTAREPQEGDWPPTVEATTPLIDPDVVKPEDLPEPTVGGKALELLGSRRDQLGRIRQALQTEREDRGFELMLRLALGHPNPGDRVRQDVDALQRDLASSNPSVVESAKQRIAQDLHLSVDAFARLMTIRQKDHDTDPLRRPTAEEYAEIYDLLTKARKRKQEFPKWIDEEEQTWRAEAQLGGADVAYWRASKAKLPRWRASAEARQVWQDALRTRSQPSIIDPDLIGPDDLRDSIAEPALALLQARDAWTQTQRSTLDATRKAQPTALAVFDAIVAHPDAGLGIKGVDLVALAEVRTSGHAISARLEQLSLTSAAFNHLIKIRDLALRQLPILDEEWETAYSILIQANKERLFAQWGEEEHEKRINLLPDHFSIPRATGIAVPPLEPKKLDPWRASFQARRDWQETLQSRIDQESAVIAGLHEAVSAVEELVLPALRNALVEAAGFAGTDFDAKAKWVTERFLIDAKADGCQKTTRIEQALETLQSLLSALRAGYFKNDLDFSDLTAVSWGMDRIDVFARGPDNGLWHRWQDAGKWHPWEALGGIIQYGPAAVSRGVGKLDVFACGQDGQLIHRVFENDVWSDWKPLGGALTSGPAGVFLPPGQIEVFVRGTDGELHRHALQNGVSQGWQPSLSGLQVSSAPAAASSAPGRVDVFGRGTDNALYQHVLQNGVSQGWQPSLGGGLASAPAAVSAAPGRVDVFVRGTDNALYQHVLQAVAPQGWQPSLDNVLTSGPAACSSAPGRLDVLARDGHGALATRSFASNVWGGWELVDALALSLKADEFDEEWKWIGSYATWRAAMLVFLYPENLLHPSLHRPQTPVYKKEIVDALRANQRLTPEEACSRARKYADYFRDVCLLDIQATCQTSSQINKGDPCALVDAGRRVLFYMFGRAPSGRILLVRCRSAGSLRIRAEILGTDTRVRRCMDYADRRGDPLSDVIGS